MKFLIICYHSLRSLIYSIKKIYVLKSKWWHIFLIWKLKNIIAWIEGVAIFLPVFIVVFVGSYNLYKKEEQFFKLEVLDQEDKFVSKRIPPSDLMKIGL